MGSTVEQDGPTLSEYHMPANESNLCQCGKRHVIIHSVEPRWLVECLFDEYRKDGVHAVNGHRNRNNS